MRLNKAEQSTVSRHKSVNNRLRTVLKDIYLDECFDPVRFSQHERDIRTYGETIIEGRHTVNGVSVRLGAGVDQNEPYVPLPLDLPMYDKQQQENGLWRIK